MRMIERLTRVLPPIVITVALLIVGAGAAVLTPLVIWHTAVDLAAQSAGAQARPRVEFEVVSVKVHSGEPGAARGISFSPAGRFAWSYMTVRQLMESAYAEADFKQIAGGPEWVDTTHFDIVATSPEALKEIGPGGTPHGLFRRMRTMLEDRFQLKTHIENRDVSVYALQPVSTPMVMGPALRKTDIDCEAMMHETVEGRRPDVPYGQTPPCALATRPGQLNGHAIAMAQIVNVLAAPAGRPVVDRTGLAGTYDVTLKWAPEFPPGTLLNGAPPPASDGPSLFTAIREQLGLKLEATRASVPVLVIDSVQLPTPD